MKKGLLIILLFISVFASVVCLNFSVSNETNEVLAEDANGYHVEQVFQDKFNKSELDSSWKLNGATQELNYCGLHCISPVGYGSGPVLNKVKLANKTQINFTIYPQSGNTNSNITFIIGVESPTAALKEPDVDCKVMFWNNQVVFCDWQHNLEVNHELESAHVLRGFNGLYSDLQRTDVSIVIERKSDSLTQIYVEYSRNEQVIYSTKTQAFELNNPRNFDKYCGFFWDAVEMDITNFEAYNNDKLVWENDLSNSSSLTYDATDYNLGDIHINTTLNESQVYVSRVASIKMDDANDSIINSNALTQIDDVNTPYSLAYSIKINELNDNSFFGFGFGLSETDTKIDAKNAIGLLKRDKLTAEIVVLKNGKIDRSNGYQISLNKLGNGKYINCSINLDAANNAYLTIGGSTFKFSNMDIYGRTGIGLVSINATKSSNVEMNDFSLSKNVCNMYSSEDVSNNFSGTYVPDPDSPALVSPYLNDQKYYLGTNVAIEEDWTTGETAVTFSNANAYSGFGYTSPYSEWILEFDIELYTQGSNQMFGVSFGRTSFVDVLVQASTSSNSYLIRCDGGSACSQITYGSNCKFENGSTSISCPINMYKKNSKYHMIFVAQNRTVSVYFKGENDPVEDLGILRAKMTDLNIDGYVTIVGNNYISFGVTNYKLVNLSDACTTESELTLRESFNDQNNLSNKITLDASSTISDNKLVLNNSNVSTTKQKLYSILRFTTYELENSLDIAFSTDKKVTIDAKNNKIIITEGTTTKEYDCSAMNLSYVKGKRFEVRILSDQIVISYKGSYDPQDKLHESFVTYNLTSVLTKDNIIVSANGKAVLDDLYLYSLDNSEDCLTLNFDDDPNTQEVWKVKPDFDASKVFVYEEKGCKSSVSAISVVILATLALPVLALRKKEEER